MRNSTLPVFAPASENPQKKQSESATGRVQKNVPDGRLASRHEGLMDLVGGRIKRDKNESGPGVSPEPGASIGWTRFSQSPPNQQSEDCIFSDMRGFSDGENNRVN